MFKIKVLWRKMNTAIKNPEMFLIKPLTKFSKFFSDEFYVKTNFRLRMGKKLDLINPQTFNEKLNWLKLYYRKPALTKMVDKYEAKRYVANLIGGEHVIPTFGVWNTFEEIDFDELPNQFVLKTTHDQGGVVICKDKNLFDFKFARKILNKHLKIKHFYISREWPYKNVKPRIIAEKYMVDGSMKELPDFKFFCFDGVPKALYVATDRQGNKVKFDYFDMEFNHLNFRQQYEQSEKEVERPKSFDKMVELTKILSKGLPHVRVDFYEIDEQVFFGELTFFHHGGHTPFYPEKWDYKLGSWVSLPINHD